MSASPGSPRRTSVISATTTTASPSSTVWVTCPMSDAAASPSTGVPPGRYCHPSSGVNRSDPFCANVCASRSCRASTRFTLSASAASRPAADRLDRMSEKSTVVGVTDTLATLEAVMPTGPRSPDAAMIAIPPGWCRNAALKAALRSCSCVALGARPVDVVVSTAVIVLRSTASRIRSPDRLRLMLVNAGRRRIYSCRDSAWSMCGALLTPYRGRRGITVLASSSPPVVLPCEDRARGRLRCAPRLRLHDQGAVQARTLRRRDRRRGPRGRLVPAGDGRGHRRTRHRTRGRAARSGPSRRVGGGLPDRLLHPRGAGARHGARGDARRGRLVVAHGRTGRARLRCARRGGHYDAGPVRELRHARRTPVDDRPRTARFVDPGPRGAGGHRGPLRRLGGRPHDRRRAAAPAGRRHRTPGTPPVSADHADETLPLLSTPADGVPPVIDTPTGLAEVVHALDTGSGPVAVDAE